MNDVQNNYDHVYSHVLNRQNHVDDVNVDVCDDANVPIVQNHVIIRSHYLKYVYDDVYAWVVQKKRKKNEDFNDAY